MKPNNAGVRFPHRDLEEPPQGEDDDTIWLLSYADLMTLLFTFFVMLYSSLIMDESETLRRTLASYIQGDGGNKEMTSSQNSMEIFRAIKKEISNRIEEEQFGHDVQVQVKGQGLSITLSSSLLFDLENSGSHLWMRKLFNQN